MGFETTTILFHLPPLSAPGLFMCRLDEPHKALSLLSTLYCTLPLKLAVYSARAKTAAITEIYLGLRIRHNPNFCFGFGFGFCFGLCFGFDFGCVSFLYWAIN